QHNRAFELQSGPAHLDLSRVTITGGANTNGYVGDGIGIWNGASLVVTDSAFVNNTATNSGVAIHMYNADVTILRSAFTGNESTAKEAAIFAEMYGGGGGTLTIGESVFAMNPDSNGDSVNVKIDSNYSNITLVNLGNNLFD